jgi:hypothetical protein
MDVVDWLRGLGREQYVVSFRKMLSRPIFCLI